MAAADTAPQPPDSAGRPRLLENLIPLRGDTSGPQLPGWTPGPPVASGLGCLVWANQMVPVGDGVCLAADVYTREIPDATRPW